MELGRIPMTTEEGSYHHNWQVGSPEIVEIGEESTSMDGGFNDVYVAVGKNDLHAVKWALDHAVSSEKLCFPCACFPSYYLHPCSRFNSKDKVQSFKNRKRRIHILAFGIVGRLSKSQLSKEQVQVYQ
ncbi:uncharacterized protein LOC111407635 isoform X2 [Olea europaea var. sylvestris]|uniref:uncharacterized protein LOC111407635 isoform X2 n=1 Tax=Olea europaea var. sylvestris TaxID=158386 RepID=UPI000C1CFFD3|nr:uncharacterized protein LOC111407635 isoform X2 [Olea europaea var. sylvestris]